MGERAPRAVLMSSFFDSLYQRALPAVGQCEVAAFGREQDAAVNSARRTKHLFWAMRTGLGA